MTLSMRKSRPTPKLYEEPERLKIDGVRMPSTKVISASRTPISAHTRVEEKVINTREVPKKPKSASKSRPGSSKTRMKEAKAGRAKLPAIAANVNSEDENEDCVEIDNKTETVIYFPQLEESQKKEEQDSVKNDCKDDTKADKKTKKKVLKKRRKKRTDSATVVKYFEGSDGRQTDDSTKEGSESEFNGRRSSSSSSRSASPSSTSLSSSASSSPSTSSDNSSPDSGNSSLGSSASSGGRPSLHFSRGAIRRSKAKRGSRRPRQRRRRPSITPPSLPRITCPDSKQILEYITEVQEYMSELSYNHDGPENFKIRTQGTLITHNNTAKDMIRECLPIKCMEATILGIYLTNNIPGVGRFTINFKSEIHDKTFKPGRKYYYHVVLGILYKGKFGAIGLSRKSNLMDKPITFTSLFELVQEYKRSYTACQHTLLKVRIGDLIPHQQYCAGTIPWRGITVKNLPTRNGFVADKEPVEEYGTYLKNRVRFEGLFTRITQQSLLNSSQEYQIYSKSVQTCSTDEL